MKYFTLLALGILLSSCNKKNEQVSSTAIVPTKTDTLKNTESETLQRWISFYKTTNPDFSVDKFSLSGTSEIAFTKGYVPGNFETQFNQIYEPFLVYNESKTQYLDFDSYHWQLDGRGTPIFEADQQVNLVNIPEKKVQQIGFFGPSFRIEEGYWEGDSVAVVLGNTYEKVPFFIKYNLIKNTKENYQYPDTLRFEKSYFYHRLMEKGFRPK